MNHILYIPGLGGESSLKTQRRWVSLLNVLPGRRKIEFFEPKWQTDEPYSTKFQRLESAYEELQGTTQLFAASAGASLAVRLAVEHPEIQMTHLVSGKVLRPESIGKQYLRQAPGFITAVEHGSKAVQDTDGSKFTCYIPKSDADGVIESPDMLVPGATIVDLPALKHATAIAYALFRYLPFL